MHMMFMKILTNGKPRKYFLKTLNLNLFIYYILIIQRSVQISKRLNSDYIVYSKNVCNSLVLLIITFLLYFLDL